MLIIKVKALMKYICGSCFPTYPLLNWSLEKKDLKWALFQLLSLFSELNVTTKLNNFPIISLPTLNLLVSYRNHTYISFWSKKNITIHKHHF